MTDDKKEEKEKEKDPKPQEENTEPKRQKVFGDVVEGITKDD